MTPRRNPERSLSAAPHGRRGARPHWREINAHVSAEREACAKVCEEIEDEYCERESLRYAELRTDAQTGASDCAAAIHARGDA